MIHAEGDAGLPKESVGPSEQPLITEGIMQDISVNNDTPRVQQSDSGTSTQNVQVNNASASVAIGDGCSMKTDNKEPDPRTVLLGLPQAELQLLCSLLAREGYEIFDN